MGAALFLDCASLSLHMCHMLKAPPWGLPGPQWDKELERVKHCIAIALVYSIVNPKEYQIILFVQKLRPILLNGWLVKIYFPMHFLTLASPTHNAVHLSAEELVVQDRRRWFIMYFSSLPWQAPNSCISHRKSLVEVTKINYCIVPLSLSYYWWQKYRSDLD